MLTAPAGQWGARLEGGGEPARRGSPGGPLPPPAVGQEPGWRSLDVSRRGDGGHSHGQFLGTSMGCQRAGEDQGQGQGQASSPSP